MDPNVPKTSIDRTATDFAALRIGVKVRARRRDDIISASRIRTILEKLKNRFKKRMGKDDLKAIDTTVKEINSEIRNIEQVGEETLEELTDQAKDLAKDIEKKVR